MATYLVGDIQGCYASLRTLLRRAGFGARDTLWCVGDLVNRGPDSLATLRFARDLGPRFAGVLGNHDLHFLAIVYGGHDERPGDTLGETLAAPDCAVLADWLRRQPLLLEADAAVIVHAGIPHVWDLARARRAAREVEGVLRGPEHRAFFQAMYGDGPAWDETLVGMDRQRAIVNYFTRMRLVDGQGGLEFAHKGAPAAPPPGYRPWYAYPPKVDKRIYFGHWAALDGITGVGHAVGLDTGCVWGRRMTLARLPEGTVHSVPAALRDRPPPAAAA